MTTSAATRVDPVTFEVLRHRLAMIVDEAAQVLKEVSGSPVAAEVGDCNAALMDAEGNSIVVGPLLLGHALSCANLVKYVLAHFQGTPGIQPGDMFISNDPYRSTPHQACVVVVAPIFHAERLVAWSGAGIHLADVGGPIPGQVAVGAQSIFEEPTPMPPMRIIEGGVMRPDIQEDWLVRGRTRDANALDLRAKIASNHRLERRFREMVDRYGIDTVTRVLAQTIDFTADTIRARLRTIPDGSWYVETLLDYDDQGKLDLYKCCLKLSKRDGHMLLDFTGTSPQAPAVINSTGAGLDIAVVHAMLALTTWDLPKCPSGVLRTYDKVAEPGSFIQATWPAGVTKATTAANVAVRQAVHLATSRMFATAEAFAERAMAQGYGYSALVEMGGRDQRGEIFAACLLDHSMSSGMAARSSSDGVDSGGSIGAGGASSLANVETYEQRYPLLYLTRRELPDTGGPGRYRGGVACYTMVTPHDTERIPDMILHRLGVHVPADRGIFGGFPASTNQFVIQRGSNIQQLFRDGVLPIDLSQVAGQEYVPPGHCRTHLDYGDIYASITAGGGGYGDPLERPAEAVAADVREGYLSPDLAAAAYGVVLREDGSVDGEATQTRRHECRARPPRPQSTAAASHPDQRHLATRSDAIGTDHGSPALTGRRRRPLFGCECGAVLGPADKDYRAYLPYVDEPCSAAGPYCLNLIAEPCVALREYVCPSCGVLVEVDVVEREG